MNKRRLTVGSLKKGEIKPFIATPLLETKIESTNKKGADYVLIIEQKGKQYRLSSIKGITVLEAALTQNIPLDYKCKKGKCGRCMIKMIKGVEQLSKATAIEREKLNNDLGNQRLACQAVIN